jgi:hypothetical protein
MLFFARGVQREMKIRVFSDLYLEFQDWVPPKWDADIIVLAGDIHVGVHGVEWGRSRIHQSRDGCCPEWNERLPPHMLRK